MALIAFGFAQHSSTVTLNTTGATLIVACATGASGVNAVTENKSNGSATTLTAKSASGTPVIQLSYWVSPAHVGSGHVFTDNSDYGFYIAAYDNPIGGGFDKENGNTGSGTSLQPGSVDSTANNSLFILGVGCDGTGAAPTCSSFTTVDSHAFSNSLNYGSGLFHHFETGDEGSLNPTATVPSGNVAAVIAVFGVTGGSGLGGSGAAAHYYATPNL